MTNNILYKELENLYGTTRMVEFSEIISTMYELLYTDDKKNSFPEYSDNGFEAEWWNNKHNELKQNAYVLNRDDQ